MDRQTAGFRLRHGLRLVLWSMALLIAAAPAALRADDGQRLSIIEENDSLFFDSDKHYTQGLRIGYLGPDVKPGSGWNEPPVVR